MIVFHLEGPLTRRLHLIAGGLVFGVFLAYAALNAAFTFDMVLRSGNPSWLPSTRDELVAFEGRGVVRGFDLRRQFAGRPPGESYRVLLRRDIFPPRPWRRPWWPPRAPGPWASRNTTTSR